MDRSPVRFVIEARDAHSRARAGRLETAHGAVETPAFLPVATRGAVKAIPPDALRALGVRMILANTFHLSLRPGEQRVARLGGLHRFMAWDGPILTDSGGYQVFSLGAHTTIREDGVTFRSPLDGSPVWFTPARVMAIQRALGSDIVLPLDQPARWGEDPEPALRRSLAWLDESLREPLGEHQAMFAIVQGGFDPRLRRRAAEECAARNPAGFAIGGLSVGEPSEVMWEMAHVACAALPEERPRHLLGVGMPRDIVCAVAAGCDLFDCVLPTRLGRTGWAFTSEGILKLRHAAFRDDPRPLDERCACPACRRFSRAYLRHCLDEREIVGATLLSQHNVWAYMRLMEDIRAHIRAGTFGRFARSFGERAM